MMQTPWPALQSSHWTNWLVVTISRLSGVRPSPIREEGLLVLDALTGWGRMAVILLYATGARPGEGRDMLWRDASLTPGELRLSGVPRFIPRGLRRAAVDAMARAGVDIATAASITGHSPAVMLKHYRTVSSADRRRAVLDAGLGVVSEGKVIPLRAADGEGS